MRFQTRNIGICLTTTTYCSRTYTELKIASRYKDKNKPDFVLEIIYADLYAALHSYEGIKQSF